MQAKTHAQLAQAARRGDGQALERLLYAMQPRLYATALTITRDADRAADAVGDTFYHACRSIRTLRHCEFVDTWLTRILLNCARAQLRRREVPMAELPETAQERFDALPIAQAVAALPEELKTVIALRFQADLTVKEVARLLRLPEGTVKTRLRKALGLLRVEMEEEE